MTIDPYIPLLLAGILVVSVLVLAAPVELRVSFSILDGIYRVAIELSVWPAWRYKSVVSPKGGKNAGHKKKSIFNCTGITGVLNELFFWHRVFNQVKHSFCHLLRNTRINKMVWETGYGLDDPFLTGMTAGLVWSVKGVLVSLISRCCRIMRTPQLKVVPDFRNTCLLTYFESVFSTRAVYIVTAFLLFSASLFYSGAMLDIFRHFIKKRKQNQL